MPLYERKEGGRVVERVRTVQNSFEDTRLGLLANARAENPDKAQGVGLNWHLVDETTPAAAAAPTEKPKQDSGG